MISANIDWPAFTVFVFFFALVSVMGFVAARWRRPKTLAHIDEWGLGGPAPANAGINSRANSLTDCAVVFLGQLQPAFVQLGQAAPAAVHVVENAELHAHSPAARLRSFSAIRCFNCSGVRRTMSSFWCAYRS
jgi:hypothetical protein